MKCLIVVFLAAIFSCAVQADDSSTGSVGKLVKSVIPKNWHLVEDKDRVVASLANIRLVGMVNSATSKPTEEDWADEQSRTNFMIEIRSTPLLSDDAFKKLRQLRNDLRDDEIRKRTGKEGHPPDGMEICDIEWKIDLMFPLPYCHDERTSFYFSFTAMRSNPQSRPAEAVALADAVWDALGKHYELYRPTQQREGFDFDRSIGERR